MKACIAILLVVVALCYFGGCDKIKEVKEWLVEDSSTEKQPTVIAKAEKREAERQDKTWTKENIQKNPYLYLQDQIKSCDLLKAQLEAQAIGVNKYKN